VRFAAGYDTTGITEAVADAKAGNTGAIPGDLADGFYIDDTPLADGLPATYIGIEGSIGVSAGVGVAELASAGIGGGITMNIGISLKDSGPTNGSLSPAYLKANDNDNKTRLKEFAAWVEEYGNPLCAFNLDGSIDFDLYAEEQLLLGSFQQTLVSETLFDFTTGANCFDQAEPLGSETNGVVTLYTGPLWQNRDVWQDANGDEQTGASPGTGWTLVKGPSGEGQDNFEITERGPGDIIVFGGEWQQRGIHWRNRYCRHPGHRQEFVDDRQRIDRGGR
jgi:hypothetical protein